MARINTGRAVLGGLVAGIVLWVGDLVANTVLMKAEWDAFLTRLQIDAAAMQTFGAMVGWVLTDLLFGVVIVWTYAAIRPRFGPGPKTAVVAGMMLFVTMTLMMYGFMSMGVFSEAYFLKSSLTYLVVFALAATAGAFCYKED